MIRIMHRVCLIALLLIALGCSGRAESLAIAEIADDELQSGGAAAQGGAMSLPEAPAAPVSQAGASASTGAGGTLSASASTISYALAGDGSYYPSEPPRPACTLRPEPSKCVRITGDGFRVWEAWSTGDLNCWPQTDRRLLVCWSGALPVRVEGHVLTVELDAPPTAGGCVLCDGYNGRFAS
jgi:hypothetical protein